MRGLETELSRVRERIHRYSGARKLNEENTKATVVEPILRVLGWDVEDPEEVQREFKRRSSDKPVDYALLIQRVPRLFVEVKGLGNDLTDRKWANQIMGYASVAGVRWVVLTNGDEYRIFNSHAPVPVEKKLFRSVAVSEATPLLAETLLLLSKENLTGNRIEVLWEAHFVDERVRSALDDLFSAGVPGDSLVRIIRKHAQDLTAKDIRSSLMRARLLVDFPTPIGEVPQKGRQRKGRAKPDEPTQVGVEMKHLIATGLIRPPLQLEIAYKGHRLTAQIEPDGRVTCLGVAYDSLSTAAAMARQSIIGPRPDGKPPHTNGWTFWRFRDKDGALRPIDDVRRLYLKGASR